MHEHPPMMTVAGWIDSEAAPGLSGPWYVGAPLLLVLLEFIPSFSKELPHAMNS